MTVRTVTGARTKSLAVMVARETLPNTNTVRQTWTRQPIDCCIADLVGALNAQALWTKHSRCGHGLGPGTIHLWDGRVLEVGWKGIAYATQRKTFGCRGCPVAKHKRDSVAVLGGGTTGATSGVA